MWAGGPGGEEAACYLLFIHLCYNYRSSAFWEFIHVRQVSEHGKLHLLNPFLNSINVNSIIVHCIWTDKETNLQEENRWRKQITAQARAQCARWAIDGEYWFCLVLINNTETVFNFRENTRESHLCALHTSGDLCKLDANIQCDKPGSVAATASASLCHPLPCQHNMVSSGEEDSGTVRVAILH